MLQGYVLLATDLFGRIQLQIYTFKSQLPNRRVLINDSLMINHDDRNRDAVNLSLLRNIREWTGVQRAEEFFRLAKDEEAIAIVIVDVRQTEQGT